METEDAGYEVLRLARAQRNRPATAILTAYPPSDESWRKIGGVVAGQANWNAPTRAATGNLAGAPRGHTTPATRRNRLVGRTQIWGKSQEERGSSTFLEFLPAFLPAGSFQPSDLRR